MQILGEHLDLLQAVRAEWDKAEQDVKTAELVCSKVVLPAIKELRYAGRRIVDALRCIEEDKLEEAKDFLCDARFDCMRARHDAIDVATAKMAIDIDIMIKKLGYDCILPACANFPTIVSELTEIRIKISKSRGDRANREMIYSSIESVDFPSMVQSFQRMKASERIMRSLASKGRKNDFIGYVGAIAGIVGVALGIAGIIWGDDLKNYFYPKTSPTEIVISDKHREAPPPTFLNSIP